MTQRQKQWHNRSVKQKQKYTILTRDQVLDIIRAYHYSDQTQQALAERYNTNTGYVSRLVNGEARPDCYAQVKAEESATTTAGA